MKLKEHYGVIYLLTIKTNGLIYVGQTIDLTRRIKEYKNKSKSLPHSCLYKCMYEINQAGFDNIEFEILDYAESKEELDEKEIFWIDKLDATNPDIGMNIKAGGRGGFMSQDYMYRIDLSERTLGIHTPDVKRKKSKRIIAFKDNKALIFDGAILFGEKFGFPRTNVTAVTKGKGNRLGGYYLFYLDNIEELRDVYNLRKTKMAMPNIKKSYFNSYKKYTELFEIVAKGVETIESNGYEIEYFHYE